jgi:anti-anti-sigma factor
MSQEELFQNLGRTFATFKGFSVKAEELPGATGGILVTLTGNLEGEAANNLMEPLIGLIDGWHGAPRVVIDLSALEYISSLGIGTLTMVAATSRKRSIGVSLRNPRPSVRHVLDLLGIPRYIPIEAADA